MSEDVQVVPKWLKELEEKRERRLKARLGHEAGAGSPCLKCGIKCPGLDLHFWRKICKNCKCGKENHDVDDDDIYGWAQFQLLGCKPNKSKKLIISGRKEVLLLDWMPKGVADAVESYLKDLPLNLLPIRGSAAALKRKQLLQKQIPFHDIDPSLCHALSEPEIKKMNEYISDVKQNSVGVGRIIKLNELLIANRTPMQIPQMENIILQGANRSNEIQKNLQGLKLDEHRLPVLVPNSPLGNKIDYQSPLTVNNTHDVKYFANEPYTSNLKMYPGASHNQTIDYQTPHNTNIHDVKYPICANSIDKGLNNNTLLPNQLIPHEDHQNPLNMHTRDLIHPVNKTQPFNNQTATQNVFNTLCEKQGNLQIPNNARQNFIDRQYATNVGNIKDINYSCNTENQGSLNGNVPGNLHFEDRNNTSTAASKNPYNNQIDNQYAMNPNIRDINHSASVNLSNDGNSLGILDEHHKQNPIELHDNYSKVNQTKDVSNSENYPNSNTFANNRQIIQNALGDSTQIKQSLHGNLQTPLIPFANKIDQQVPIHPGNVRDINYSLQNPANIHDINYTTQQPTNVRDSNYPTQHPIANIKDLAYSTYNPQPSKNPDEVNATPTSVNIGLIKDIEHPTLQMNIHTQDISEPSIPRKNVHFNLVPEEILPSCHKCKKMFEVTSFVIGIDRTDALWHSDCFKCAGCNQNIADLMYFYDNSSDNIYCGRDYAKIRGIPRCQACDELIFVKEYCLAENSTFHVKHFCCLECDVPLAGKNYVMEDSQPLCLPCFELLKAEKCNTCKEVIKPDERGANLKEVHYHANDKCFACKSCKKPLLGSKFLYRNKNVYCSAQCIGTY